MSDFKLIGTGAARHDAWAKAKGEQAYSDDFALPGMIYGKVLRSAYPAAVIKNINTQKAKTLPGVHAVLTSADVPRNTDVSKFGQMRDVGGGFEGLYKVLADGKVRYKGEAVALVAADTEEICEEACRLIEVDYRIEPGVFCPEEALLPGAYLVSGEDKSNQIMRTKVEKGDVEAAFAKAHVIVENEYRTPAVDHAYIETEGGVAWVDENEVITLRVGTQVLEHYRTVAKIMDLPHNKVRNMGVPMGGGFGGKEDITVESFLALLAWHTRRPVKMIWSREESLECHAKRHPEILRYKTGAAKDGTIIAQQVEIVMDGGGYTYLTPWVQMYSTIYAPGCYRIDNLEVNSVSAFTNNTFASANRGFGSCQVNIAYESQMDEVAAKLGISPYEIRKINCLRQGDEISTGYIPEGSVVLEELLDKTWEKLVNSGPKQEYTQEGWKIGRGLACGMMPYGRLCFLHDSSRVGIRVELDGSVTVRAGVPDLGGGQSSVLCQIAAEELGLPINKVHSFVMDTHLTPLAGTTTATRQLYMSGNACLVAVGQVKEVLAKKAAAALNCLAAELTFAGERIFLTKEPERGLAFVQVVAQASNDGEPLFCEGQFNAPFTEVPDLTNIKGRIHPDLTFTAHAVEVAVDEETGQYKILKLIAGIDAGRVINRNSCEGQVEGGAVYNVGYVNENLGWEKGITRANSFATYLIPTALDVPDLETVILESGGGLGPYGAKGVGEPSDNSIAPAILNAIRDATGYRVTSMPVTPESLLAGVKSIHNS
ncbi:MAG: xanthine dehydrogenase family protein molybdopterin-binding subunit [Clostridiales bacterium]|nr:xanthine dehydrogenase family protein molybdopterin-binding subunit [Clostridiales bacterium]